MTNPIEHYSVELPGMADNLPYAPAGCTATADHGIGLMSWFSVGSSEIW
jgi:hypothetical protein